MMNSEASAADARILLNNASAADTTAATGGWIDVREYEGDLMIYQHIGAITGQIAGKIQDADTSGGSGSADVAGATFATQGSANSLLKISVPTNSLRGWIRYVGTITTGPCTVAAGFFARKKVI